MKTHILWNKEAGYVGNNILFWRKKGHGYTCDLDDAELYTKSYTDRYAKESQGKFISLNFAHMEKLSKREIDIQALRSYLDNTKEEL